MLALLRLAVSGFFFGLFEVLAYFAARLLLRAALPLTSDFPGSLAARLPTLFPVRDRGVGRGGRLFLFLRDLLLTLLAFLSLIIFLFWQADGTVRAFVLLTAFLGGLLSVKLYGRYLVHLEYRLIFLVKYPLLILIRPPLALLLRCGGFFLAFLRKILSFFIKVLKRYDTVLVSGRYKRRAVRILGGRRARREILAAIERAGGTG